MSCIHSTIDSSSLIRSFIGHHTFIWPISHIHEIEVRSKVCPSFPGNRKKVARLEVDFSAECRLQSGKQQLLPFFSWWRHFSCVFLLPCYLSDFPNLDTTVSVSWPRNLVLFVTDNSALVNIELSTEKQFIKVSKT